MAADHTTTLAGGRPVLVLDMYEHAYHMDYGAAAARYVDIYMEPFAGYAAKLYEQYSRKVRRSASTMSSRSQPPTLLDLQQGRDRGVGFDLA